MRIALIILCFSLSQLCLAQKQIKIDSLSFSLDIPEKKSAPRSFELVLQTRGISAFAYAINISFVKQGVNLSISIDSIIQPQILYPTSGPATKKIDLGELKTGKYHLIISKKNDTSICDLIISKEYHSLKIVKKGFLVNEDIIYRKIPENTIWVLMRYSNTADSILESKFVNLILNAGAKRKKFLPGFYKEFVVTDNHLVLPSDSYGQPHEKMYALYYKGEFDILRNLLHSFKNTEIKGRQFVITIQNDRGENAHS